jgi:hypothetical protein
MLALTDITLAGSVAPVTGMVITCLYPEVRLDL